MFSVDNEDKEVQGIWYCLKERESSYLVGFVIVECLFYTVPVMSVHSTGDNEVQGLFERKWRL